MPTSENEDGRPTAGGAAQPVHIMNPQAIGAGGAGGGGPSTIANGADVNAGSTTDAAVITDSNGTLSSKLRGLISLLVNKITVIIAGAGGTPVQLDDTDKLAVSLYAKGTVAGDTALKQTPINSGVLAVSNFISTGGADGIANVVNYGRSEFDASLPQIVTQSLFNGATLDQLRNNHEVTALASAARTASVNSVDLVNYNARGVIVVVDITALTATGTLTVTVQGKDTLSGKYYTLLASALLAATGTTVLVVYPGTTIAANLDANSPLPRVLRVSVVAGNGVSITYSIGVNYCS